MTRVITQILVGATIASLAGGYLALHAEIAGLRVETNQRFGARFQMWLDSQQRNPAAASRK
ncbi:MAG TPA: hypothetical protein VMT29_05990 [Steroidobacteraceae bacterium]|nr:hypothetical protein [Steroidobacteraceae bacterium]